MNQFFLDFAVCKHGHQTPIRPSKISIPSEDQRSKDTETELEYFVCNECRRIYEVDPDSLESHPSPWGLEPYIPGSPMRRFEVWLPCEEAYGCLPIRVIAVLKADTTDAQLETEKSTWKGRALRCPKGHFQSFPSGWE